VTHLSRRRAASVGRWDGEKLTEPEVLDDQRRPWLHEARIRKTLITVVGCKRKAGAFEFEHRKRARAVEQKHIARPCALDAVFPSTSMEVRPSFTKKRS
jgi:hypothetical protein